MTADRNFERARHLRREQASVFISYRRSDTRCIVGRLVDHLRAEFGEHAIICDIDSIPAGVDYRVYLEQQIASSVAVLAVIGPAWSGHADGAPRLGEPHDFVRMEVGLALALGKHVLPLLVENAALPSAQLLPAELVGLRARQALSLDPGLNFRVDVSRLTARLRELGLSVAAGEQELRIVHVKQDRDPHGFPLVSLTLANRSPRSQIVHRLDLQILAFSPLRSAGMTRVLEPIDVWDVALPREPGARSYVPDAPILIQPDDAARVGLRFSCGPTHQAVSASRAGRWLLELRFHTDGALEAASEVRL